MKKNLILFCMFLFSFNALPANQDQDRWISYWYSGAKEAKNRNYTKAISEYTHAINGIEKDKLSNHLYLFIERGNAYIGDRKYQQAIEDFNFALKEGSIREDKLDALWGRSQAFLLSGNCQEFVKDIEALNQMEPTSVLSPVESENYVIFKVAPRMRMNKNVEESFISVLKNKHAIDSEQDVIFTPTGKGIIKKSKSKDAPKSSIFE